MLQRPDFHIYGTAPTIDGTAVLVDRLRSALGRGAITGASDWAETA